MRSRATRPPAGRIGATALAGLSAVLLTGCAAPAGTGGPDPAVPAPTAATTGWTPTATTSTGSTTSGAVATTVTTTGTTTTSAALTSTTAAPASTTLRRGDAGPEVLALQERLTGLGYWLGPADGSFGPLAQQAVFALQGAAGLARDGIVGPNTRAALDAGARPTARSDRGAVTEIDRDAGLISFVRDGQVQLAMHTSTGTFEPYTHEGRRLMADTRRDRTPSAGPTTVGATAAWAGSTARATSTPTASPCTATRACRPTPPRTAARG